MPARATPARVAAGAAAAGVSGLVAVERAFASDMISLEQRDALIADLAV